MLKIYLMISVYYPTLVSETVTAGWHTTSRPGCRGGKIPTDQCEQLDIRYPGRMGHLEAGTRFILSWERAVKKAGRIDACVADNVLVLRWQAGGEIEREHRIQILSTACKYGGDRPWFKCPDQRCGRRVAILSARGKLRMSSLRRPRVSHAA